MHHKVGSASSSHAVDSKYNKKSVQRSSLSGKQWDEGVQDQHNQHPPGDKSMSSSRRTCFYRNHFRALK